MDLLIIREDPSVIFLATWHGLFISKDGGESWQQSLSLENDPVTALAASPSGDRIYVTSNLHGILVSTDGGIQWRETNRDLLAQWALTLKRSNTSVYLGSYGGGVFRTDDQAASWIPKTEGQFGQYVDSFAIDPTDPRVWYFSVYGWVYKTTDEGQSWKSYQVGVWAPLRSLCVDPANPLTLYAAAGWEGVMKSEDGGLSWKLLRNGLTNLDIRGLALSPTDPSVLFVSTYGSGVFKSTNGGISWQACGEMPNPWVEQLAIDPHNASVIYAGGDRLSKSTDGGATWNQILDAWVPSVLVDERNPGRVLAGSVNKVYISHDAGTTWSEVGSGLPASRIVSLCFDAQDQNRLYAGTYGLSVFAVDLAEAGCAAAASAPSPTAFPAEGGSGNVTVSAVADCPWTVTNNVPWILIPSGSTYAGPDTVVFTVAANTGSARSGNLAVAGRTFIINQAAGCEYSINPPSAYFEPTGGTGSFELSSLIGACPWTATSSKPWLQITSPASGAGSATITYNVGPNSGADRTATISVAGLVFTATQESGCSLQISPARADFGDLGGGGAITVNSGQGCPWNATTSKSWIAITSGAPGSGYGTVQYAVAPNSGPGVRTGAI
ncbi:MAG: hypothetical protein EHM35_14485, partial [Planctomycetaceae bacterium]